MSVWFFVLLTTISCSMSFSFFNSFSLFLDFSGFTASRNSLKNSLGGKLSEVLTDLSILLSHSDTNFMYESID